MADPDRAIYRVALFADNALMWLSIAHRPQQYADNNIEAEPGSFVAQAMRCARLAICMNDWS
jgi:hypothetical protein